MGGTIRSQHFHDFDVCNIADLEVVEHGFAALVAGHVGFGMLVEVRLGLAHKRESSASVVCVADIAVDAFPAFFALALSAVLP